MYILYGTSLTYGEVTATTVTLCAALLAVNSTYVAVATTEVTPSAGVAGSNDHVTLSVISSVLESLIVAVTVNSEGSHWLAVVYVVKDIAPLTAIEVAYALSDLYKYKFDPLDRVLMERIRYTITEDIKRWEPRISLISIEFLTDHIAIDNSILYVSISYRIINTDVIGNYVYPYKMNTYDTLDISYNQGRW